MDNDNTTYFNCCPDHDLANNDDCVESNYCPSNVHTIRNYINIYGDIARLSNGAEIGSFDIDSFN